MTNHNLSRFTSLTRLISGLLLSLFAVGCSGTPLSSSVQDFSGSQLYGTGMADGTLSLTFDDGPGPRTAELSRYLKEEGVQATFFIQGSAAAAYPEVLKQLHADGHRLANHTYSHPRMTTATDPVTEVRRTDELIKKYVTDGVFLFRAPYGDWNGKVATVLNSAGLTKYVGSIFWDIGGVRTEGTDKRLNTAADWACWAFNDSVETCADGYMNEIRDLGRGIVLMHDMHSRTVDMVKNMVPRLKNERYRFVSLESIPTVSAALARRTNTGDAPPPALSCPAGFSPTDVGTQGGKLCVSETEASGPFTQGMIAACREKGGGDACGNARWSRGLALWLHGAGRCPVGASFDSALNICVEGENVFGPFAQSQVKACRAASANPTSPVCESNRWSRGFFASLAR
ncbi:MAG: polysaccharide deacetylase family protein [Betaproteobacteria bacterium]|nr:polysaccharide deacetylase family protein [Betaproteobacteria bacterium]